MMLPDGELAAMWKAARGLRRTATQYDALASEWPDEASHYQSEAEREQRWRDGSALSGAQLGVGRW